MYRVFSRKVWQRRNGQWAPYAGRKTTIRRGVRTIEEARALCADGPANRARAAGREYRALAFYEFERED